MADIDHAEAVRLAPPLTRTPRPRGALYRGIHAAALAPVAARGDGKMAEWTAGIAEVHDRLAGGDGPRLPDPSPIGEAMHRALESAPEFAELAAACAMYPRAAAEATAALADGVAAAIGLDRMRADPDAARDPRDARTEAREAREAAEAAMVEGRYADARAAHARVEAAEKAAAMSEGRRGAAMKVLGDAGEGIGRAVARAAETAREQADAARALAGMGCGAGAGGADPATVNPALVKMAAKTPELRRILALAGALRRSADAQGRPAREIPGREGIDGPGTGGLDRLADLVPSERAALSGALGDAARLLATVRLARGAARVWDRPGGRGERGPVVIALDCSGSMAAGNRAEWARAVALAVAVGALREGRAVCLFSFDGHARQTYTARKIGDLAGIVRGIVGPSGGTDIRAAMVAAAGELRALPRGGQHGDVLCITDGEFDAGDAAVPLPHGAKLRVAIIGQTAPTIPAAASVWCVGESPTADAGAQIARAV
jgi:uncharacterized protein with von Willebrand factor type A (vWA) domain